MKKSSRLFLIMILLIIMLCSCFDSVQAVADKNLKNPEIDINLKKVDLETALISLANLADKNLICDKSVKGKITVILNKIKFLAALDLITDSFDLGYFEKDNTIFVSSAKRLNEINKTIITKNFDLKYLSSERVIKILQKNYPDLKLVNLNSAGIVITADQKKLKEIAEFLTKIDQPQKQVLIKAKVIEISRTKVKELGINPDQITRLELIKDDQDNLSKLKLSWPETLKALTEKGLTKVLANPSLMTLDRKKAKLIIGDQIPVKLESVEDDKTVSTLKYIEGGIVLEFLPKVLTNNTVLLEVKPSINSLGKVLADGLPSVNSRSASTTVLLENGQTLAIGGLMKNENLETVSKLPILADLPILGSVFSEKSKTKLKTELIIFITPKIINSTSENLVNHKIIKKSQSENIRLEKNKLKKQDLDSEKENINNKQKYPFKSLTAAELREILAR